ncbi:MAG TPA: AGE family epimerase/isomerase, partial [Spirochaetia bacterium]|nr:AGE family epimerase/isomerase [Spirochaetia bacterium]
MELYDKIEKYLVEKLYPFWYQRVAAPEGGFTTYFDRNGRPTGQTEKTLIQQTRSIFMLSHAIRNGYAAGRAEGLLKPGLDWFLRVFHDREHDGWYWIVDKTGAPVSTDKIMYGQS